MPNHYHLLVYLRENNLSQKMHGFTLSYTKAINRRYERCGALFQGRFQAIHVDEENYLLHLSRYIHLNPVKAGFVQRPEEWEFSSYPDYVELRCGTLPRFAEVRRQAGTAQDYETFVGASDYRQQLAMQHLMFDE
ncbi:MAG: transposase, partial [Cyanobacteria bacterium J06635_15]